MEDNRKKVGPMVEIYNNLEEEDSLNLNQKTENGHQLVESGRQERVKSRDLAGERNIEEKAVEDGT